MNLAIYYIQTANPKPQSLGLKGWERQGLQCGEGDSDNPRDSPQDSGDGKDKDCSGVKGTVRIPGTVLRNQGMGETEGLQCCAGDRENPSDSLSPPDSGDGKDRGTAVLCRGQ